MTDWAEVEVFGSALFVGKTAEEKNAICDMLRRARQMPTWEELQNTKGVLCDGQNWVAVGGKTGVWVNRVSYETIKRVVMSAE